MTLDGLVRHILNVVINDEALQKHAHKYAAAVSGEAKEDNLYNTAYTEFTQHVMSQAQASLIHLDIERQIEAGLEPQMRTTRRL